MWGPSAAGASTRADPSGSRRGCCSTPFCHRPAFHTTFLGKQGADACNLLSGEPQQLGHHPSPLGAGYDATPAPWVGLEAARFFPLSHGASLFPSMVLGIRQGGRDAEAGFGVDPGAGICWKAPGCDISGALRGPHPPRPCCGADPLPKPQKLQPALVPGAPLPPGPDGAREGAWWRAVVQDYRGLALPHGGKAFKGAASKGQNGRKFSGASLGQAAGTMKSHGLILDY